MACRKRSVEPEWLDTLPGSDPRAAQSRRDLRRVNACMGHAVMVAQRVRGLGGTPVCRIVEIGAGDGAFLLSVARRLAGNGHRAEAVLVDRQSILRAQTAREFQALGWRVEAIQADVLDWLARADESPAEVMIANLFLHHFHDETLKTMLAAVAQRTRAFIACEPRRSRAALAAARLLGLIGCNRVTRHDAVISVRAGFRGRELSALWPETGGWEVREESAGLFSHCFVARGDRRPG